MKFEDLQVGMKVKITTNEDHLLNAAEEKYAGTTVTIANMIGDCIYVKENNYNWLPSQLEPITETKIDSKFVVKIETVEEGIEALKMFNAYVGRERDAIKRFIDYYSAMLGADEKTVALEINNNTFTGWANVSFYKENESKFGKIYTLAEIKGYNTKEEETEEKAKFVVALKTVPEVLEAFEMFDYPYRTGGMKGRAESFLRMLRGTNGDKDTLAFAIVEGKYSGWCDLAFYKEHTAEYGRVYTINEIKADKKLKTKMEEKKMKEKATLNNIPKKKEFKDFTVKTETIERWIKGQKKSITKTTVSTPYGTASAEKETAFADERKGCLYACAKIMAQKSETNKILYELGNERVEHFINIEILANHAVRNGNFAKTYNKYKTIEEYNYAIDCRCTICGKQFDTPEQAREHEKWHSLNRKAKHDRYLIRREAREKIAKAAHDEAVAAEIKKLMEAE